MVCGLIGGTTLAIWRGSEIPFVHGRVNTPNAIQQVIKFNIRCSWQAHSKKPKTDHGNENIKYGCVFKRLYVQSIIRLLIRMDAQFR